MSNKGDGSLAVEEEQDRGGLAPNQRHQHLMGDKDQVPLVLTVSCLSLSVLWVKRDKEEEKGKRERHRNQALFDIKCLNKKIKSLFLPSTSLAKPDQAHPRSVSA